MGTRPARSKAKHSQRVKRIGPSSESKKKMFDLQARIEPWSSASDIWRFVLTPSEQNRLGGNLKKAFRAHGGTVGMLQRLWGCTPAAAIIQIYERTGSVPGPELARLRRAFNLPVVQPESKDTKPVWNATTCQLTFRGTVIRKYRGESVARNVTRILDKFEETKWPEWISDPLSTLPDPHRLRESIRSLNRGLQLIRFSADGNGKGVVWEVL